MNANRSSSQNLGNPYAPYSLRACILRSRLSSNCTPSKIACCTAMPIQTNLHTGQEKPHRRYFARWRITDPLKFLVSVHKMFLMHNRAWTTSFFQRCAKELGQRTLVEIVVTHREDIMKKVTERSLPRGSQALGLGIDILDVRIKRADPAARKQKQRV